MSISSIPAPTAAASNPSKSKKKSKVSPPITPDQARINFLQTELAGAQARIVKLDADLKEKDERVTILTARIKVFEEENTKAVYEKYFPHASSVRTPPDPAHDRPTAPPNDAKRSPCTRASVCGCHCPPPPPPRCQSLSQCSSYHTCQEPTQSDGLLLLLNNLNTEITDLKKVSVSMQSSLETLKSSGVFYDSLKPRDSEDPHPPPTNSATTTEINNISVASIEEFMDVIEDTVNNEEIPPSLNYQALTIQQQ